MKQRPITNCDDCDGVMYWIHKFLASPHVFVILLWIYLVLIGLKLLLISSSKFLLKRINQNSSPNDLRLFRYMQLDIASIDLGKQIIICLSLLMLFTMIIDFHPEIIVKTKKLTDQTTLTPTNSFAPYSTPTSTPSPSWLSTGYKAPSNGKWKIQNPWVLLWDYIKGQVNGSNSYW